MSHQIAPPDFALARDGDVWVATHVETGVTSQGGDPNEAVAMAEEAVELSQQHHDPAAEAVQEELRRELDIADDESEPIDSPTGMP